LVSTTPRATVAHLLNTKSEPHSEPHKEATWKAWP